MHPRPGRGGRPSSSGQCGHRLLGHLAWTWDAWGSCPGVLITDYASDATPHGAAYHAILQALP